MSLISEALRKVRQDRPDGDGLPPTFAPAPRPPRRGSSGLGLVVGVLAGAGAAIAGGAVVWWALAAQPPQSPTAPSRAATASDPTDPASPPPPATTPPARTGAPPESTADLVDQGPPRLSPVDPALPAPPAPTPHGPGVARPTPGPAVPSPAPAPPGPTPRPAPAPTVGPGGELVFLLDGEVDGVRLSLDYIISRPTDPFAAINGRDVVIGSIVDGFRVEEISQHHVRLSRSGQTVILRAR